MKKFQHIAISLLFITGSSSKERKQSDGASAAMKTIMLKLTHTIKKARGEKKLTLGTISLDHLISTYLVESVGFSYKMNTDLYESNAVQSRMQTHCPLPAF